MATPHIEAKLGDIAKTVLMPGDPLRAKFIADTFLQDVVQFNTVRGMLGFTGTYNGKKVSVMGSGMGMPSIGIYSYELFTQYEVENIIRIGSAGAYSDKVDVYDVVLATAAYSESSFAKTQNGCTDDTILPSESLNEQLKQSAQQQNIPMFEGVIHSSDVFYKKQQDENTTPYWQILRDEKGCLAVEMESFALFHNAKVTGKNAACVITISDHFVNHKETTSAERQTSFTNMMKIALGAI